MAVRVAGLGEVLWDVYPDARYPGGAPANVAVHARRLGAEGVVASGIGEDASGDALLDALAGLGVNTEAIQRVPDKPTGTVSVRLDADGHPHFDCSRDTAFDHLAWTPALASLSRTADAVAFGTLAQRHPDSRRTIRTFLKETKALRVFDVNFRGFGPETGKIVRETLPLTDVLKLNEDEAEALRGFFGKGGLSDESFLKELVQEYGLRLAVLSLGARGCFLSDGRSHLFSPGFPVRAVDTTGCGDAFVAALIVRYLDGTPLEEAGRFMNRAGALTATRRGAVPVYSIQEVEAVGESTKRGSGKGSRGQKSSGLRNG